MQSWRYDGFHYRRRQTRTVSVGDVEVGGAHPIRVQSMTTPPTRDTAATVQQIARLVDAGCEIVRVTVPTTADADNLPNIRGELTRRKISVPLVADIHFTPAAAMKAIEHVDKIRINPGNYADKKKFATREYSDAEYDSELERIAEVFSPLVKRAQQLGVSMRIGTNHGSLSDRIMNRYGDTPEGMVESALEFVRICESHGYRDLILSMKSSNPVVVLQVYRLLATRMAEQSMDYPFHLGVTEAGDGEDGRIKSAIGIGALLEEGIGDTIRVSLTEDPVHEIPVALGLAERFNRRSGPAEAVETVRSIIPSAHDPFVYRRRRSSTTKAGPRILGGEHPVLVEVPLHTKLTDASAIRAEVDAQAGTRVPEETRAELVSVTLNSTDELTALTELRGSIELVAPNLALSVELHERRLADFSDEQAVALISGAHRLHLRFDGSGGAGAIGRFEPWLDRAAEASTAILAEVGTTGCDPETSVELAVEMARLTRRSSESNVMLAISGSPEVSPLHAVRLLATRLADNDLSTPLLLIDRPLERGVDPLLGPSQALGGLLCDGIGDGIHVAAPSAVDSRRLGFSILQAARVRITRTEFISCPSCGRTLFDLEKTTARIKQRTAHLKGLKIAVMGCVVNGPGEMADADFGYVGWGEDKIALFVGKEMVEKNIPTSQADERLVQLIKKNGRWIDPPVPVAEKA